MHPKAILTQKKQEFKKALAARSPNQGSINAWNHEEGTEQQALTETEIIFVRGQLQAVEEALQHLQDGTYGTCKECGKQIPPERLEALPYASLCLSCQRSKERVQKRRVRCRR